jgi:O-antigen/teichoic acid export membrane protein
MRLIYSIRNRNLTSAISFTVFKVLFQVIALALFLYFEMRLSEFQFGNYILYISYVPLLHALLSFHAEKYLNTKYYTVNRKDTFYSEMVITLVRLWIIVLVITVSLLVYINVTWVLLVLLVFGTVLLELKYAVLRLNQNHKTFIYVISVEILSFVILSLLALELNSFNAIIMAILLSKTISYMVCYVPVDWSTESNINFNPVEFFKFVAPISASAVGLWFYQNYDRQVISSTFGVNELADYGVNLKLASTIGLLSAAYFSYAAPLYYKHFNLSNTKRLKQIILSMYLFPLSIAIIILIFFHVFRPIKSNDLILMILYFLILTYSSIVSMKIMALGRTFVISLLNCLVGLIAFILMSQSLDTINEVLWIKVIASVLYFSSIYFYSRIVS